MWDLGCAHAVIRGRPPSNWIRAVNRTGLPSPFFVNLHIRVLVFFGFLLALTLLAIRRARRGARRFSRRSLDRRHALLIRLFAFLHVSRALRGYVVTQVESDAPCNLRASAV